jgi:hypothetical protein
MTICRILHELLILQDQQIDDETKTKKRSRKLAGMSNEKHNMPSVFPPHLFDLKDFLMER